MFNCTEILEKQGAEKKNAQPTIELYLTDQKNIIFCNGEVFFIDPGLLMGGISVGLAEFNNTNGNYNPDYRGELSDAYEMLTLFL